MSVALNSQMTGGNGTGVNPANGYEQYAANATSISSTGTTVGEVATCLLGFLVFGGGASPVLPTGVSMTWNGAAMTVQANDGILQGQSWAASYIFSLVRPASGTLTQAAAWTNAQDCYMSLSCWSGTDQVTGVNVADNITTTSAQSLTITSTVDGATVANAASSGGTIVLINGTLLWRDGEGNPDGSCSYFLSGTSNTHTWTINGLFCIAGVHLLAAIMTDEDLHYACVEAA